MSTRHCLRDAVPEIQLAADLLDMAVTAHLTGDRSRAADHIYQANMPEVRAWTESLWGKNSPYAPRVRGARSPLARVPDRMPGTALRLAIHERDGYHCRFCGIPVIRKLIRERVRASYPELEIWGRKNSEQHAAFQAMWAQYDHLVPHWYGGENKIENLILTCAPCNYARMGFSLEEAGLTNPLKREPIRSCWDGLERFK
jgi:hypothetical protein